MRHLVIALAALTGACGISTPPAPLDGCDDCDLGSEVLRDQMGTVFQMEHYQAAVEPSVLRTVRDDPPGSIIFWNPEHVGARDIRHVIVTYSTAATEAGHLPILFSADYEGGALAPSHTFKHVAGIQRFTEGFTALAHGRWLGKAYRYDPELGLELARLHGAIIGRELDSVGINYPLSVVSDLAHNLFTVRGVDTDPDMAGELLGEIVESATTGTDIVFATKHFPGLGQTSGDTHEDLVVSPVMDNETAEAHLHPFRALSERFAGTPLADRLSIMCSHAKFPFYDPDANTTTSPVILQSLLRDEVGFGGIALSDAMWMGSYGQMSSAQVYRIYLQAFVAGLDMLMIPGPKYAGAVSYFRQVFDGDVSEAEKQELEALFGEDFPDIHAQFVDRLEQSITRINRVRASLTPPEEVVDDPDVVPSDATAELRARYYEILKQVDPRWVDELP